MRSHAKHGVCLLRRLPGPQQRREKQGNAGQAAQGRVLPGFSWRGAPSVASSRYPPNFTVVALTPPRRTRLGSAVASVKSPAEATRLLNHPRGSSNAWGRVCLRHPIMPRSSRHRAREKKWANPSARKHSFSTVRERAFWTIFTENSKIPQKSRCSAHWDPPDTPQTKVWSGWDRTTFGYESPRHAAFTITLHSTRIDIRGGGIPIPRPMLRSPKPSVPRGLAFSGLQGRHNGVPCAVPRSTVDRFAFGAGGGPHPLTQ